MTYEEFISDIDFGKDGFTFMLSLFENIFSKDIYVKRHTGGFVREFAFHMHRKNQDSALYWVDADGANSILTRIQDRVLKEVPIRHHLGTMYSNRLVSVADITLDIETGRCENFYILGASSDQIQEIMENVEFNRIHILRELRIFFVN